ncbi:MAG: DUF169 domain-containing protein [Methanothrix sp.]|nr:DUF169 domain-containing protein [Methanothrix sp.]
MSAILGLSSFPVGIRFLTRKEEIKGALALDKHRYCQALMRARHGQNVVLDAEGISCPAAARAFGFRPLPEPLRTGKGLVGFGIVSEEKVAEEMFEKMPHLKMEAIEQIHKFHEFKNHTRGLLQNNFESQLPFHARQAYM